MSLRPLRLSLLFPLAGAVGAYAQPAGAPGPAVTPGAALPAMIGNNGMIDSLKLPGTDLDTMLNLLRDLTGRVIVSPSALPPGPFNLMIDRPMSKEDVIIAIETVLSLNGIGTAPEGEKFLKVVPLQSIRTEAPEMIVGSALSLPASGKIATKIFTLGFLRVNEFVQQIGGLLSLGTGGPQSVVQLPSANAALITDTVTNLQRIEALLIEVDKPATAALKPKFYTLKNGAKASDVVAKIRATIGQQLQLQLGTAVTYSADDRSNQIILIADPRQQPFFDELIDKLDVKSDPNTRNEVIPLKHATSKDVAPVLIQLVSNQNSAAARASQSVRPGQGIQNPNLLQNNPNLLGNQPGIQPNLGGVPGVNPPGVNQPPTTAAINAAGTSMEGLGGSNEFSTLLSIQSFDPSNSIVVSGTVDDIRLIKELVSKLDVLLAQVRIEVIIAEVTLSDTDTSGISALNLTVGTDTPATGDNGRGTHITNFAGTVAGWAVTSGVVNPLAFQSALSDAGSRNQVKVLQAPTIVTAHAKEGRVIVGQEVPYVSNASSSTATAATTDVVNQSTSFKDINLDLKVTPYIGDDGAIQLNVDQLVQDQIGSVVVNGSPVPTIGTRHAIAFVNVYDGQMIVLGGLQRTSLTNTRNKLGFIYEIPIISNLLGARSKITQRTELLMFVRPHVLKPQEGTDDAAKSISTLSNKDQINEYLKDPSKTPKEGVIERFK